MNRFRPGLAIVLVLFLGSAHALYADVRADQKNLVKFEGVLGKIVGIFGGKAAREGVKSSEAVKGNRKSSLTDTTGQIVDLSEEKIYDLDLKKKSYKVTTFEELRKRMADAQKKAEEEQRKAEEEAKKHPETAPADLPPDNSGKQVDIDFNVKDTGERKAINGFDTHEILMTITMREKGKTLEQSGGLVITADSWLTPAIAAMKELAEFNIRYAKQLAGPMFVGASPEEMASAVAMYPGLTDGLARMRTEGAKLDGTPILTNVTVDAVKSAEQVAAEQEQAAKQSSSSSGTPASVGGLVGGLMKKVGPKPAPPKSRVTIMTINNEILKVTTDVTAADVAIPAGFKESK